MNRNKTLLQKCAFVILVLSLIGLTVYGLIKGITLANESYAFRQRELTYAEIVPYGDNSSKPVTKKAESKSVTDTTTFKEPGIYIAKTVYGEARGLSKTEQAAVVWCILNRVDAYGSDIISVVTAPSQFHGYSPNNPIVDDIYNLTIDVLQRWNNEKNGEVNVGRILPKEYLYFYGLNGHNHFTTKWQGRDKWDWRLESPYET